MTYNSFVELLQNNKNAFYVFDTTEIKERIDFIRNHIPESVDLCYAVKANTFVIKEMIDYVDRFEICSPGEYEICRTLGVPANKMVISGVYKTPDFIENLIASDNGDIILTVESMIQFEHMKSVSEKYKKRINILVRLTNGSQFGINSSDIEKIIANRDDYDYIDILGIQFFSGTQKTSVKKIKREISSVDLLLNKLKDEYGYIASEFEYGTGFPVSYFEGEDNIEKEIFSEFSKSISEMSFKTKIIIELGRSAVASCGKYFTHIVDIKCNKDQNYAIIDGGMHHLVYYGQYMAMKQPVLSVCGKEHKVKLKSWNICGSLCSMNDIIAKQVELPEIEKGDVICFEKTGAYCVTEGISLFLSRDIPAVYLFDGKSKYKCARNTVETVELNMPKY